MFLKKIFSKIWYLIKQNKFWILSSIICSVLLFLYLISFVHEFGAKHDFYSEGLTPKEKYKLPYFMLTVPFVIPYIIYVVQVFKNLTFLRTLIYPVHLITLFISLDYCVPIFGGDIVWLAVYLFFPLMFVLLIVEIKAYFLDIESFQKTSIEE